jgi:hypothetical protein
VVLGLLRNIKRTYIYLLLANIALTAVFICILLFATQPPFPAALATLVLCLLAIGAVPVAYNNLEGSVPTSVKATCALLIVSGVVTIAVLGYVLQVASNFAIFSFVMWAGYIVLLLTASAMFYQQEENRFESPHVYSAYGQPVYKFDSHTEKLKRSITHKVIYDLAGIVVVVYSATVTLVFTQKSYAVYALSYYLATTFLQEVLFALKTHNELAEHKDKITPELVGKALKDLSTKYMVDFHNNPGSRVVEEEKLKRKEEAEKTTDLDQLNAVYSVLARKHQEWMNVCEEEEKFLFFWTALIVFAVFNERKAEMLKLINDAK